VNKREEKKNTHAGGKGRNLKVQQTATESFENLLSRAVDCRNLMAMGQSNRKEKLASACALQIEISTLGPNTTLVVAAHHQ